MPDPAIVEEDSIARIEQREPPQPAAVRSTDFGHTFFNILTRNQNYQNPVDTVAVQAFRRRAAKFFR